WQSGELTASGYPYIVRRLARGQQLSDAVEVYRGAAADGGYGVSPTTLVDGEGHRVTIIHRPLPTFEGEHYIVRPGDVARLGLPLKSQVAELFKGQVIVQLSEDWRIGGKTIAGGSLAGFGGAAANA